MDGLGSEWRGLKTLLGRKLGKDVEWDIEIWVLPHKHGVAMYNWKAFRDYRASDWLDREVFEEFGRELYIEVHIVMKKGEETRGEREVMKKAKIDLQEGGVAGKMRKVVHDVDEDE